MGESMGEGAERSALTEHQPYLDGLRAVAVYLVVAFHAGASRASGGFVGVDVFFVLSGFLVTRSLLGNRRATGAIDLGRFYSRRVRRLLPAAAVNLVVTALVFRWLASPAEVSEAAGGIKAAALYVSNWWFIAEQADYFGSSIDANPVLHYWSLSVEEQFYVLWPLLLIGLSWVSRRIPRGGDRLVVGAVAALGATSLVAALVIERTDLGRAYYGTDTRAYQLFAGALLALVPGVVSRVGRVRSGPWTVPAATAAALVGLLVLATDLVAVTPVRRGALATIATLVVLVGLQVPSRNPVRRVLARPSMAFLGRISYGTYLWHWIVVQVLVRKLELSPLPVFAVTAVVATGIAALSYEVLERPILHGSRSRARPLPVIAAGVTCSLLIGLVAVPRTLDDVPSVTVTTAPREGTPVTVDLDAAIRRSTDAAVGCGVDGVLCSIHRGGGPRVLLLGDSHAEMLAPALRGVAADLDLELAGAFSWYCPWARGLAYYWPDPDRCYRAQDEVLDDVVADFDPDLVVLGGIGVDDATNPVAMLHPERGLLDPGPERAALVEERMRAVVAGLRADGRRVLLLEPVPVADPQEPVSHCLSEAAFVEACRRIAAVEATAQERSMRRLAEDDGVWSLDLDRLVCPYLPICDPIIGGSVVSLDGNHLTADFASTFSMPIRDFIVANEVLAGIDP